MPGLDAAAVAAAVKKEIERQQEAINYDELPAEQLEAAVQSLQRRLALCQEAIAKRGGEAAPAARKAAKSEGTFPDLPFTKPDGTQDADKITAYLTEQMSNRIMIMDGAMGTAIQQYKFTEEDFRGACRCASPDAAARVAMRSNAWPVGR